MPLPGKTDDESGGLPAHLVYWIRRREQRVRFTSVISALTTTLAEKADELRLREEPEYKLFGVWVPLGQVNYRVPVKVLRTEREGAVWRTEFEPSRGWLKAKITPPRGRASIRRSGGGRGRHPAPPSA